LASLLANGELDRRCPAEALTIGIVDDQQGAIEIGKSDRVADQSQRRGNEGIVRAAD